MKATCIFCPIAGQYDATAAVKKRRLVVLPIGNTKKRERQAVGIYHA